MRLVYTHALPCIVITDDVEPAREIVEEADRANVPLMRTRAATPIAMARLSAALDVHLAVRGIVHGVLMDILGLGRADCRGERHRQE